MTNFCIYWSWLVHLPGRLGGGTTGGCTIPLMGSRIGSSLGGGSGLDIGVDTCKHKHDAFKNADWQLKGKPKSHTILSFSLVDSPSLR